MIRAHKLSQATRKPYWLLLALVLFLAGQIASAQHWHNSVSDKADYDCALCVLSGATAAIIPAALIIAGTALVVFFLLENKRTFVRRCVYAYESRAPPFNS
jgi:hypothetical protein